jgi:hypothetical protein
MLIFWIFFSQLLYNEKKLILKKKLAHNQNTCKQIYAHIDLKMKSQIDALWHVISIFNNLANVYFGEISHATTKKIK